MKISHSKYLKITISGAGLVQASFHAGQAVKELAGVDATVSIVQQIEEFLGNDEDLMRWWPWLVAMVGGQMVATWWLNGDVK